MTDVRNTPPTPSPDDLHVLAGEYVLGTLAAGKRQIGEIILSGGEPTLHPQLAEIAQRCKATGALVSINTHGAHPGLLERALPWVDELKLHIDSFDPQRQKHSMGLSIDKVLQSIERSRGRHHFLTFFIELLANAHGTAGTFDRVTPTDRHSDKSIFRQENPQHLDLSTYTACGPIAEPIGDDLRRCILLLDGSLPTALLSVSGK